MPRIKAAAPMKRDLPADSNPHQSPPKKEKKETWKIRRRVLATLPADMVMLGEAPVPCAWLDDTERPDVPARFICMRETDDGEQELVAEFPGGVLAPIAPAHPILANLLALWPRGQTYALVRVESSPEELLINVGVAALPWTGATEVVESLYSRDYSEYPVEDEIRGEPSWNDFFRELSQVQAERRIDLGDAYQHEDLKPKLRRYQAAAVAWMITREERPLATLNLSWLSTVADQVPVRNGPPLIYNKYSGVLSEPLPPITLASGGILADEMGLGKTVITLALLLNHTRPPFELPAAFTESASSSDYGDSDSESDSDSDDSERQRNKETCLDANEKLQMLPTRLQRGTLKSKLTEWYNIKLAEMSTTKRSSVAPKKRRGGFKCTCGGTKGSKRSSKAGLVTCSGCGLKQHRACTGYSPDFTYFCPPCWANLDPVPSAATLIVAPQSIFSQWLSEAARHAPSLKVFPYKGVLVDGFIQPTVLAGYDVIVTTYDILSNETAYTEEAPERQLRREGRFLRQICPLTQIGFWRVCCDEAQLFQSDVAKIQQMIHLLTAEHRWSVTGTPVQRTIADLFYLTQFMGMGPLDYKPAWVNLLLKPYLAGCKTPLLSVLGQVFWRSSKDDVMEELGLPEQTFTHHLLRFTPIEETFYVQEHQNSAAKLHEAIRKSGVESSRTLDSLDRSRLRKILMPLLNLRQACTHPQVVSGVSISSTTGAASVNDLLTYLSRKAKLECEESLRRYIAAMNGLAGLHCLQENYSQAITCYRSVLQLTEEYKDKVKVDTLQRIHALSNAAHILKLYPTGIPPTLRDHLLEDEAKALEEKYLSKPQVNLKSSYDLFFDLNKEITKLENEFESAPDSYWERALYGLGPYEEELVSKMREELHSNLESKTEMDKILKTVNSIISMERTIRVWWASLVKNRSLAVENLPVLKEMPISALVGQATACHLRTHEGPKKRCELCKVERFMLNLECDLFATKRKKNKEGSEHDKLMDGAETKSSWIANQNQRALVVMFNFARSKISIDAWAQADFKLHVQMLEAMKKEFKHLRAAWTELNHLVQAEDELAMARIRLRLAEPWETPQRTSALSLIQPNKTDNIHVIHSYQVDPMLVDLARDRDFSYSDFKKKYGRMLYLGNLGSKRNAAPEPCPVCKTQLEKQWVVLECGHCFCISCIQKLCVKKIKCPVCREATDGRNLSFVDSTERSEHTDISVAGDFPSKVDSIVRTTLQLLKDDPSTKILIFSTWPEVLKVLEHALRLNLVSLLRLQPGKHQKILEQFRDPAGGISVLLLPLSWGARGLNLVEAQHVFLTEPILNPSDELQAIGRVHRIGQTKPTTVHRFLIAGTIEEKIHAAVTDAKDKWSNKQISLDDLQNLFVMPDRLEATPAPSNV